MTTEIRVKCACKRRFRAHTSLAGKTVECPHCGESIVIPVPESNSSVADDAGNSDDKAGSSKSKSKKPKPAADWESCPGCAGPISGSSIVCTNCGYNRRTKKKHLSSKEARSRTFWFRLAPAVLGAIVIMGLIQTQLSGFEFLSCYVLLSFAGTLTTIGADYKELGKERTFLLCLIAWELLGLVRYVYGISIGMENFELMFMAMVVVPAIGAAFVFSDSDGSGAGGWLFSSSCGSGCGGGCGGGGCGGGCGGCGG